MALQKKTIRPKTSNVEFMFSTHEPLDERHQVEREQEDDYFRKLDHELIVALREKSATEIEQAIRTYTCMRCPKCGVHRNGVSAPGLLAVALTGGKDHGKLSRTV